MKVRTSHRHAVVCLLLIAGALLLPFGLHAQGANYNFARIDYPGATVTDPGGLNDSATVVGWYFGQDDAVHSFIYTGTAITSFDYPGASATGAGGVNNSGVITGYYNDIAGTHGFVDTNGAFTSFDCTGSAGLTNAHAINNNGEIVGVCDNGSGSHGFLNSNGSFTYFDFPGGFNTVLFGINDNGQMVGTYTDAPSGNTHGFIYSNGNYTAINYPGASQTFTYGINNAGVVVGSGVDGMFLWQNGQFTVIQSSSSPVGYGINNNGQITGIYFPSGEHGFLATPSSSSALQFLPSIPCRLVDTRNTGGPIQGETSRDFTVPQLGGCNIPNSAQAYSLNVTVVPHGPLGYLTIWPTGESQPTVSTMNSPDGRVKANAAIVPAGTTGAVSVFVSNTSDVILDINGYFTQASDATLAFYPLAPCRVIDTRNADGNLTGPFLTGGVERDFPVPDSPCLPANSGAAAYSFNVTVVPHPAGEQLGYLTVWPTGEPQPSVSTLNNLTATVVANAAIVPAGSSGAVAMVASNDTDVVVDINGYFAAPASGGLSLYAVTPCRVLDTRENNGQPFIGWLVVPVMSSQCAPPATAQAYVFNATVVPPGGLGYLTLWPDGQQQPTVSTLNALDGFVTSNMAIVPTQNGSIDAFASNLTQLVLDISSYFAP